MLVFKKLLGLCFTIYTIMILIRILGSWFPQWSDQPWMRFVASATDPYLDLFRRIIPPIGGLDLSPMIAMLSLYGLEWILFVIL